MKDILKDIKTGALPVDEIPSFIAYLFRKSFWVLLIIVVVGVAVFAR